MTCIQEKKEGGDGETETKKGGKGEKRRSEREKDIRDVEQQETRMFLQSFFQFGTGQYCVCPLKIVFD